MLLFLLVAGVFLPALRNDFIYYDDPGFVMKNSHVLGGLTWANARWAFVSADIDYWRPLSWLSHMLDCQIFGLDPWGHHLTSILLHALNSLLVFAVLLKMTGAVWRSWLVAALFGLHPLHVESVAWIAERKDVLSTLFWLLTIWAYAHWVRQRDARARGASRFYGLALVFFALGLMTKPMLVTVPCTLLLLDFWPLNRFRSVLHRPAVSNSLPLPPKPGPASFAAVARSLVFEKVPFFALAAAVAALTVLAQKHIGALKTAANYPWSGRISNALVAYCRYLGHCGFPTRLAVFYPYSMAQPIGRVVSAGALLAGVTIAVSLLHRQRSYLLVGWLWFLGTLVPVIGLVQVGEQSMADRYSYMPLVGVFVMLVWTAGDVSERWTHRSGLLGATAAAILAGCIVLTSVQLNYWKESTTLFRHAIAVTGDNWAAHTYLGFALAKSPSHLPEAIAEYRTALGIDAEVALTHNYLGNALAKTPGRQSEAIAEFESALRLDPELADAHSNLATILVENPDRLSAAIAEYEAALRLKPDLGEVHYYLGLALTKAPGRLSEAIAEFRIALELKFEPAETRRNLARALAAMPGGLQEAVVEYQKTLQIKSDDVEAHYGLGLALADLPGRLPEAIAEYRTALRFRPDDPRLHNALGNALSETTEHLPEAIAEFQTALRLQPDLVEVHNNLGMALAQVRGRLADAIAEYETTLRAKPDFAEAHNNLGNALTQVSGRQSEAIAEYEAAIRISPNYAEAHFNLGLLLSNIPERRSEAIRHFESALRIRPDFEPARTMLERMRGAP
jgi:tetratricopeptide (TPR) repeat protein